VIETISDNHLGGKDKLWNKLNFAGELLETMQSHKIGTTERIVYNRNTYDHAGRLKSREDRIYPSTTWKKENDFIYNKKGELYQKKITYTGGIQTVDYIYNIRGWLTMINDPDVAPATSGDFFAMKLMYDDGDSHQHNGNISAMKWRSVTYPDIKIYQFTYDPVDRLTGSVFTPSGAYNTAYTYDYNGNIKSITRNGMINGRIGVVDDFILTYNGNQLLSTNDDDSDDTQLNQYTDEGSKIQTEYFYDANGRI
jgi:YD repeat-containing protein